MTLSSCAVVLFACLLLLLEVSAQTLNPFAYPLAVRSPYLNAWGNWGRIATDSSPSTAWATFYRDDQILGWSGIVQVDNVNLTFNFMGIGDIHLAPATLRSAQITPTQTILTYAAGPIRLIVDYLSPIEPDDWVKMSLPFAYMSVTAESTDGRPHEVRLYSDISGEWCSNADSNVTWSTVETAKSLQHKIERTDPKRFGEDDGMGEDGATYYAIQLSNNLSWRTGADMVTRGHFIDNGRLPNTLDDDFRKLKDAFPVMALSVDLGPVRALTEPAVWAVGKTRDPSINFQGESGLQERSSYFRSTYANMSIAIDDFLEDFPNAKRRADELDQKIQADAEAVSPEYAQLVALATRSDGAWNRSDIKMFMREMGFGCAVSPVELVYAAYPAFLYFNSSLAGRILEPLLEFQSLADYTNEYAAPNLGTAYPRATGRMIIHSQGVEHSGNMIIMALAHAKYSGDVHLITRYYSLLKRWAEYLVKNSFSPIGQTSADDLSNGNMTNLAIKGIIGIQAMSEISAAVNEPTDERMFADTAVTLVKDWATAASRGGSGLSSVYEDSASTGLMYNLYADKLLRTNLVDHSVLEAQTEFYRTQLTNGPSSFSLPVDSDASRSDVVQSHWVLMAAAATTDSAVRDLLVDSVHARAASPDYTGAFPSTYLASDGKMSGGAASAAQGAMFAPLVLNLQVQTFSTYTGNRQPEGEKSASGANVGAIAGGVLSGVAIAMLIALAFLLKRRRRQQDAFQSSNGETSADAQPTSVYAQPYTDGYHHSAMAQNGSGYFVYAGGQTGNDQQGRGEPQRGNVNYHGHDAAASQAGHFRNHIYGTDTQLRPNQYAHAQLTPATSLPSSGRRFSTRKAGRGHVDVRLELIPTGGTSSPPSAPSARLDDSTTRLRNEMETIRQQMSTLLQEREYDLPPPEYVPR
ncbi:hypothetical protein BDV98DRAFT_588814 [Pterulicium gracile]|uniref:DUF1793-domain-containing protein n=1 Tax=Pterulicium gracile TaxID=1884261 RepID=A0A5C3R1R3_9AGAR|nr:hypothetical protein BDV98DRAFT_588814 [Pterula gracilis]